MAQHKLPRFLVLLLVGMGSIAHAREPSEEAEREETEQEEQESAPPSEGGQAVLVAFRAAFERARSLYQAGQFEECTESYAELFGHDEEFPLQLEDTVEKGRLYYSACLLAVNRPEDAANQMRVALEKKPTMGSPDPVVFPREMLDLFVQVKAEFLEEEKRILDAAQAAAEQERQRREEMKRREEQRVRRLEQLAAQETVVSKNRRWVAALPFGVGQFQNGQDTLGAVFLGTETLLLGATIAATSIELGTHSQADGGQGVVDKDPFNLRIAGARQVQVWGGASFLILAGLGILEAQLNFVEEERLGTRTRRVSGVEGTSGSVLRDVTPTVTPEDGGAVLGVSGVF